MIIYPSKYNYLKYWEYSSIAKNLEKHVGFRKMFIARSRKGGSTSAKLHLLERALSNLESEIILMTRKMELDYCDGIVFKLNELR